MWSSWQMSATNQPFELVQEPLQSLDEGDVLLEVAGCGVCHTDIGFWHDGIRTRKPLPLVLGHEVSGIVAEGPPDWKDKKVIVPAVLPCGECYLCHRGRANICRSQKMPGNDFDGGFASHMKVPHRFLCEIPESLLSPYSLAELSVIADAVSTPYQAVKRSGLEKGDLAVIIGVGGIGIYGAQLALVTGAKVVAIDVDANRLKGASDVGVHGVLDVRGKSPREVKATVREMCRDIGGPGECWKIFEMSGTKEGQELAYALIGYASTLSVVGFTMHKLELRLSNLMAFDARAIGTWGCRPDLYPEILDLVAAGKVQLSPFTETYPMSQINEVFSQMMEKRLNKRAVMIPDF
ncbi:MAG: 6-hydroxycyclohex-1-ene-1-carbonyl-CoA dehydrogenase [Candidatus Neomarinimicrobiota bacterium]